MHARAITFRSVAATAVVICAITGCSAPATFAQRMAFLKTVDNEGVQTHQLIVSQGGTSTSQRCTEAYGGLQDTNDAPSDQGDDTPPSQAWLNQIQDFFVESCITGLPEPVPGQPQKSPASSSSPSEPISASESAVP
jgi:hypothetical protein